MLTCISTAQPRAKFPVNFCIKLFLWHVDVHFDCGGSHKTCGAVLGSVLLFHISILSVIIFLLNIIILNVILFLPLHLIILNFIILNIIVSSASSTSLSTSSSSFPLTSSSSTTSSATSSFANWSSATLSSSTSSSATCSSSSSPSPSSPPSTVSYIILPLPLHCLGSLAGIIFFWALTINIKSRMFQPFLQVGSWPCPPTLPERTIAAPPRWLPKPPAIALAARRHERWRPRRKRPTARRPGRLGTPRLRANLGNCFKIWRVQFQILVWPRFEG